MYPRRWQKQKLIWITASELTITIDYGLLWLYIYIHGRFSLFCISFLTGFTICSISCSTALEVRKAWNLTGTSVGNGQQFFILFGRKHYFIQKSKFSYYNNILGKVFQTSGVTGLITLLYAKLLWLKSISTLGERIS